MQNSGEESPKKFLGVGCSRVAWSLGDGTCLKVPIKERWEPGIWQNKQEFENFKLGEKDGLICFPKAVKHNRDYSKIWVEECKTLKTQEQLLDAFAWPDEWRAKVVEICSNLLKIPPSQFIGFWIFGWLEDMNLEKARPLVGDGVSDEELVKIVPFKSLVDTAKFFELAAKNTSSSMHGYVCLTANLVGRSQVLLDLLKFKFEHPEKLYIRDIWNLNQWGLSQDGKLVVIDAGYNHTIANSSHFARDRQIVKEVVRSEDFDTFNGQKCDEIFSPSGSPVEWKFFTSRGTEYVLSAEHQARRIKQAGLNDDGLHPWMDHMVFVDEQDAINAMNTMVDIQRTLTPVKLETTWESGTKLDIQKLIQDQWQTQLSVTIQDTKPQIGKNVLEFMLDGCIVKTFHAGHDVTKLKHFEV